MDELFRDHILDHYRHPRCHGTLEHPDARVEDANPLCGDKLRMDFRFRDGRVAEVRFSGSGCSISQASASLLCEAIEGRPLDEVKALTRQDVLDLLGVDELGPVRSKCAMLALKTVKAAAYGVATWKDEEDEA
ncbi:MAG TPA: iron-sulfur cluster assembly scaffold protein [Gemmatimonadales bacterium]|nr:iron-sulfur cluster assembly scaffold protein [Gemmatimonadales bacterium]